MDALEESVPELKVEARLIVTRQQHEDPIAGKVFDGLRTTFETRFLIGEETIWHRLDQLTKTQSGLPSHHNCQFVAIPP